MTIAQSGLPPQQLKHQTPVYLQNKREEEGKQQEYKMTEAQWGLPPQQLQHQTPVYFQKTREEEGKQQDEMTGA